MAFKVVGAGLGRTGTTSLKSALEELLGGRCYHMFEADKNPSHYPVWQAAAESGTMPSWDEFLGDYIAIVDWPGAAFWRELSAKYSDALVLLSVRDAESWYESARQTIFSDPGDGTAWGPMWQAILRHRFCAEVEDKAKMIAAMEAHNAAVREEIPPERLLVWQVSDGWGPLCDALGLPLPEKAFPHTNTRREYIASYGAT